MARVRRAELGDAAAMAAVHVASWESTYGSLLPRDYLAARTVSVRLAFWTDLLTEGDPAICIFVACSEDGSVCGFATGGPERTGTLGVDGELYAVYLLAGAQGAGLGRRLVEAVLDALGGAVGVWVLGVNPARGFYEHLGGKRLTEKRVDMGGEIFAEVAYDLGARSRV
jgi:GNAT superfamily N-acetyltransferase